MSRKTEVVPQHRSGRDLLSGIHNASPAVPALPALVHSTRVDIHQRVPPFVTALQLGRPSCRQHHCPFDNPLDGVLHESASAAARPRSGDVSGRLRLWVGLQGRERRGRPPPFDVGILPARRYPGDLQSIGHSWLLATTSFANSETSVGNETSTNRWDRLIVGHIRSPFPP